MGKGLGPKQLALLQLMQDLGGKWHPTEEMSKGYVATTVKALMKLADRGLVKMLPYFKLV